MTPQEKLRAIGRIVNAWLEPDVAIDGGSAQSPSSWDSLRMIQEVIGDDHAAEVERDARLGAKVRGVIATGGVGSGTPEQLDGYAQSLADDRSMFGAAVITAIADALRAEEGGE